MTTPTRLETYYALRDQTERTMTALEALILRLRSEGHEACLAYTETSTPGVGLLQFKAMYREAAPTFSNSPPSDSATANLKLPPLVTTIIPG